MKTLEKGMKFNSLLKWNPRKCCRNTQSTQLLLISFKILNVLILNLQEGNYY